MSVNFIKVNGESPKLDYPGMESSLNNLFSRYCKDADVFILNGFPVLVSPHTDIDFVVIIAVKNQKGNFISFKKDEQWVYLHNLIIPVVYNQEYKGSKASLEGDNLLIDNAVVDFSRELNSVKWEFKNYLVNRCGFSQEIFIHPVVFVECDSKIITENVLAAPNFDFTLISDWLKNNSLEIMISNLNWFHHYEMVSDDLNKVIEQASFDSVTGYLTKRKIDRIGKELSSQGNLESSLGKKTIIIKGKAGSGKTTELIALCINAMKHDYNPYFLTYNKVLTYDLSQLLKSIRNQRSIEAYATVNTLHGFFYDLSRKLSVQHVMTAERINEVLTILKSRLRQVYDLVKPQITYDKRPDYAAIKGLIQNASIDNGAKEVGIDFVNFLKGKKIDSEISLNRFSKMFFSQQKLRLSDIPPDDIFLADYYGVLKNTLLTMENPDEFYDSFRIDEKAEIIDLVSGSIDHYMGEDGKINKEKFREFNNRRIGGRRGKKRIIFIDEAQDCHRLEKEIFAALYGLENVVIANGGKEQLIRHVELCNWEVLKGKSVDSIIKNKRNKSYRIKPQIADFCNYFASKFGIDLNIEGLDTPDQGEIIFDFKGEKDPLGIFETFEYLSKKGKVNGCKEYESILVLLEILKKEGDQITERSGKALINEYGNISTSLDIDRGVWSEKHLLELVGYQFFDATIADKRMLGLPSMNQTRLIYYESCRGLESWSVACFHLDKFFDAKLLEDEAEKFLIDDEKDLNIQSLFISNEDRKRMYAATWVLMALTRVIDTLYIHIDNEDSELGKVVRDYIDETEGNIQVKR